VSRVLILTPRATDGVALEDLLAEDGHQVEVASDLQSAASVAGGAPDIIVADFEPWTWVGKVLLERFALPSAATRLVMLCARMPRGARTPGVLFLGKPVTLEALRSVLAGEVNPRFFKDAA
jgi:hypothetical protein